MVHMLLLIIYVAFVGLGLPDGLLGAAWPSIYPSMGADVAWAGIVSCVISVGTVVSSLMSDRLTYRFGCGKITAVSVGLTAVALFGFSVSDSFWMLCLFAIPYGLGAGSVDAALNNYVALHYASRHMSWLHCMWGLGASVGPYIMGYALTGGLGWNAGYRIVGLVQVLIVALLFFSLPAWKQRKADSNDPAGGKPLKLGQILGIRGAKEVLVMFFCYCGLEATAMLWSASYFVMKCGMDPDSAATWAAAFYVGMTAGRAVSGFLTVKFSDTKMIDLGCVILAVGVVILLLPLGQAAAVVGVLLMGLGCAPIYPCVIHSTPAHFGADKSQAIIGVQMASAYVGTSLMPPLFGLIAQYLSASLMPVYIGIIMVLMVLMHRRLNRVCPIE